MYKNKQYPKSKRSSYIKIALIAVVIAVLAGLAYWQFVYKNNQANSNSTESTSDQAGDDSEDINYSPPTEEEQKSSDDVKDTPATTPTTPSQSGGNTSSKKSVKPIITSVNDPSSVTGYVPGIFEEGGTCTAVFTKGGTTKTRTSTGFENSSYTQCAPISIPSGFLSSGTWTLTLKYSSSEAAGSSASQKLEI